jgi:microfibrillar-associated protein 1
MKSRPTVKRYFAGHKPVSVKEDTVHDQTTTIDKPTNATNVDQPKDVPVEEVKVVASKPRRRIFTAEIVEPAAETEPVDEPQEPKQDVVVEATSVKPATLSDQEEDEEEQESSDEELLPPTSLMIKPVFIKKGEQVAPPSTISGPSSDQKRLMAKQLASDRIHRDLKAIDVNAENDWQVVDDTDRAEDDTEAYEAWKTRELERVKRDKQITLDYIREKELIERRRNMTDEERRADELKAGVDRQQGRERGQQQFLQKYYHRGAFYVDEHKEVVARRDFTAPTDDQVKMTAVPEVMQRKNFGKKSQSKWTHLAAEDTTVKDAGWVAGIKRPRKD